MREVHELPGLLLSASMLFGCSSGELALTAIPPEGAEAWGAVSFIDGRFVSGSELRSAGEKLELEAEGDVDLYVGAWVAEGVRGSFDGVTGSDPLRLATSSDLPLPRPLSAWRRGDDQLEEVAPTSMPLLTRFVQNEGCEALSSEPVYVDTLCGEFRCLPVGRREGCLIRLEAGICTFEQSVVLAASPEGVALPTAEASGCVPLPNVGPNLPATFDCRGLAPECYYEVPAPPPRALFEVERIKVANPELALGGHAGAAPAEPWSVGNPYKIAVLGDELFMLQLETDGPVPSYDCRRRGPARLTRRSINQLATTTSSLAIGACWDQLVPLGANRLLVVSTEGDLVYLVELDRDLNETRRVLVQTGVPEGSRATALVPSLDGHRALVFFEHELLLPGRGTDFIAERWLMDLDNFEVLARRSDLGNWNSYGGAALPGGIFALASNGQDAVLFVDEQLEVRRSAERISLRTLWVFQPVYDLATTTLFVPVAGTGTIYPMNGIDFSARGAHLIEVRPTDVAIEPTVVLPSAFGPGHGLAGVTYVEGEGEARRHKSSIVLFESEGPRIPLGRYDLGEGKLADLKADGRGAAVGLLPWTGELIHIRLAGS